MKKRVLIVIQLIRRGGVEIVAINFARGLNQKKFDCDFLLLNPIESEHDKNFANELVNEGFGMFSVPESCTSYVSKYNFIKEFFKKRKYDIVHSHALLFSGLVLMAAKKNGVKVRVAHSHIIKWNHKETLPYKLYKAIMQMLLKKYANVKLACTDAAGEFLFGKKEYNKNGIFFANGIDTEKFLFDLERRESIRKEFGINAEEVIVGHVGTIYKIKNQVFLVRIFSEFLKNEPNAKLIMVGEKVDPQPVIEIANELGVTDKVIMTGSRSDINSFYSAMDIMIFPSLHEALPVSLIEAQAAKLPCLISDAVTIDVKFNENVSFLPIKESPKTWSNEAENLLTYNRQSIDISELKNNYDLKEVIKKLEELYYEQ